MGDLFDRLSWNLAHHTRYRKPRPPPGFFGPQTLKTRNVQTLSPFAGWLHWLDPSAAPPLLFWLARSKNKADKSRTLLRYSIAYHYDLIYNFIIIIIIIILFVQKPKMHQCKLKTWTLNKTHQAQTSSYGGLWEKNTVTHKYTKYSNCTKHKVHIMKAT